MNWNMWPAYAYLSALTLRSLIKAVPDPDKLPTWARGQMV